MLEKLKLLLQVKQLDSFTDEVDLTLRYCCFMLGFLSCLFGCVKITYLISVFDLERERKTLLSIFKDNFIDDNRIINTFNTAISKLIKDVWACFSYSTCAWYCIEVSHLNYFHCHNSDVAINFTINTFFTISITQNAPKF